jgi:hypothetical protein
VLVKKDFCGAKRLVFDREERPQAKASATAEQAGKKRKITHKPLQLQAKPGIAPVKTEPNPQKPKKPCNAVQYLSILTDSSPPLTLHSTRITTSQELLWPITVRFRIPRKQWLFSVGMVRSHSQAQRSFNSRAA